MPSLRPAAMAAAKFSAQVSKFWGKLCENHGILAGGD